MFLEYLFEALRSPPFYFFLVRDLTSLCVGAHSPAFLAKNGDLASVPDQPVGLVSRERRSGGGSGYGTPLATRPSSLIRRGVPLPTDASVSSALIYSPVRYYRRRIILKHDGRRRPERWNGHAGPISKKKNGSSRLPPSCDSFARFFFQPSFLFFSLNLGGYPGRPRQYSFFLQRGDVSFRGEDERNLEKRKKREEAVRLSRPCCVPADFLGPFVSRVSSSRLRGGHPSECAPGFWAGKDGHNSTFLFVSFFQCWWKS